jgi:hypothetical protein
MNKNNPTLSDLQAQINGLTERFEAHKHQEGHVSGMTSVPMFEEHDAERLSKAPTVTLEEMFADTKFPRIHRKELRTELRQLAAEAQSCCPRGFAERIDQLADRV